MNKIQKNTIKEVIYASKLHRQALCSSLRKEEMSPSLSYLPVKIVNDVIDGLNISISKLNCLLKSRKY